tara:strand:- start:448 stop:1071 length:624 start_codon:yes stop_codon:yes gene_type:complete
MRYKINFLFFVFIFSSFSLLSQSRLVTISGGTQYPSPDIFEYPSQFSTSRFNQKVRCIDPLNIQFIDFVMHPLDDNWGIRIGILSFNLQRGTYQVVDEILKSKPLFVPNFGPFGIVYKKNKTILIDITYRYGSDPFWMDWERNSIVTFNIKKYLLFHQNHDLSINFGVRFCDNYGRYNVSDKSGNQYGTLYLPQGIYCNLQYALGDI